MAKGMSMEEFRNALSSDATKENEELKKVIQKLKKDSTKEINELKEELEQYKKLCTQLSNRCAVLTKAPIGICMYCGIEDCIYHPTMDEVDEAFKYLEKHKRPNDQEKLAEEIHNILSKRRKERLANVPNSVKIGIE